MRWEAELEKKTQLYFLSKIKHTVVLLLYLTVSARFQTCLTRTKVPLSHLNQEKQKYDNNFYINNKRIFCISFPVSYSSSKLKL